MAPWTTKIAAGAAVAATQLRSGDEPSRTAATDQAARFGTAPGEPRGFTPPGPPGAFGGLDAAAPYLGLTESELRTRLESGKTLAQIAADRNKSVDGLVGALVDGAGQRVDEAVSAGRLTEQQAASIRSELKDRIGELVDGSVGPPPGGEEPPGFQDAPTSGDTV